jgi:hypothetical protein
MLRTVFPDSNNGTYFLARAGYMIATARLVASSRAQRSAERLGRMRIRLDPLILQSGNYKIAASDIVRKVTEELTAERVVANLNNLPP